MLHYSPPLDYGAHCLINIDFERVTGSIDYNLNQVNQELRRCVHCDFQWNAKQRNDIYKMEL